MHGRNIAALLAMAGLGSASLNASNGYLAMIGPASLRFQEPVRIVRPPSVEPAPAAPIATNVVAAVQPEPVTPPLETPDLPVVPEPTVSQVVSNAITDFVNGMRPDSQYVPPSVLVRYFTGTPAEGGAGVVVPVGFTPPVNPPPLRSSATYQKAP